MKYYISAFIIEENRTENNFLYRNWNLENCLQVLQSFLATYSFINPVFFYC